MVEHRSGRNLWDMIRDVAAHKSRAAHTRSSGKSTKEEPREVFFSSCVAIAKPFEDRGFKFTRTSPHMTRRAGDWRFTVGFSSSHHNVADEHVALSIGAVVRSPRIKVWRAARAHPTLGFQDTIAGGQIGNLLPDKRWFDWELADPGRRPRVVKDAIATIESIALPYFALFESLDRLIPALEASAIGEIDIGRTIELLVFLGRKDSAQRAAIRFLELRRDLVAEYKKAIAEFDQKGLLGANRSGFANELAYAQRAYGLEF